MRSLSYQEGSGVKAGVRRAHLETLLGTLWAGVTQDPARQCEGQVYRAHGW